MERDELDTIASIIQEQTRNVNACSTPNDSVELYADSDEGVGVEFVRAVGSMILDEGYYISGLREYTGDNSRVELWFDELPTESRLGTVTLEPFSDDGYDLFQKLQENYTLKVDTFHGDGSVTLIVEE
jgi:hypothetical protein